jgi:hypothetical protein
MSVQSPGVPVSTVESVPLVAGRQHVRLAAWLASAGAVLLVAGTVLHPAQADPADAVAAFTEYAGVSRAAWVTSHLTQLAGVAGTTLAMVLLSRTVAGAAGSAWSRVTATSGAAALAAAAALQAVDGVALKAMVDAWSAAPAEEEAALFAAALAVRQVEIGLAGVSTLLLAVTTLGFGLVLIAGSRVLGALALAAAATAGAGGVLLCLEGFSAGAMDVSLVSGVLGLLAVLAAVVWGARRAHGARGTGSA